MILCWECRGRERLTECLCGLEDMLNDPALINLNDRSDDTEVAP